MVFFCDFMSKNLSLAISLNSKLFVCFITIYGTSVNESTNIIISFQFQQWLYILSAMSDNGDLLTEQQLAQFVLLSKNQSKKQDKLKNWVIYCKRRGKSQVTHHQQEDEQQQYSKDLQEVGSFSTLKQFFGFYTSIKQPSTLEKDTKIFYFLKDCKPLWEEWLHSGCLLITMKFKKEQRDQLEPRIVNSIWEYLLFSLIGNNLPKPRKNHHNKNERIGKQLIVGIVLQRRSKLWLMQVWYRDELHAAELTQLLKQDIQDHIKGMCNKKLSIDMIYKQHRQSISNNSTLKGMSYNMTKISALGTALSMHW